MRKSLKINAALLFSRKNPVKYRHIAFTILLVVPTRTKRV